MRCAGKVRYVGGSSWAAWELVKALGSAERRGWARPVALQVYYALLGGELELDLLPTCRDAGVGVMAWILLAGGFLSGTYHRGAPPPEGDAASAETRAFYGIDEGRAHDVIDALAAIWRGASAARRSRSATYCTSRRWRAWWWAHTREQLADNLGAARVALGAEELACLSEAEDQTGEGAGEAE